MPSTPQDDRSAPIATPRTVSQALLASHEYRRWCKRYRTEIAASTSSLLSTVTAVSSGFALPAAAIADPTPVSSRLCEDAHANVTFHLALMPCNRPLTAAQV